MEVFTQGVMQWGLMVSAGVTSGLVVWFIVTKISRKKP